jgi:Ca2+-binding RTX toxin-like protein
VSVSLLSGAGHGGEAEGDTIIGIENLIGSAFDDWFEGNSAANKFDGGAGIDTVSYGHSLAGVTVNLNSTLAQTSAGDASGDTLIRIENVTGSAFNDTLTGNSLANTLSGGGGDDVLDGSLGADTMIGGTGNDTYFIDNAGDRVVENAAEGTDSVQSTISLTLADNVENLTLLGTGNKNGTGNAGDNVLAGNSGSNILSGLSGNDTLIGGGGNDTLSGGAGHDAFVFGPGFGKDTVTDFSVSDGDILQFDGHVFADVQHVLDASTQIGADVVIALDAANAITLKGIALSALHADEFVFV